jgi:hypothetical protein
MFLPEYYSPIILSGIVGDDERAFTTDLPIACQFHLPYLTKDGSQSSLVVATLPQVSMNMGLGLLLIKATSMIIDTVDKVVEVKHLDCPPFKIDFCHATKTILAIAKDDTTTHYDKFEDVQNVLQKTDTYIAGVCKHYQSAKSSRVCISEPHQHVGAVINSDSVSTNRYTATGFIPPPLANDNREYQDQVLGDVKYLWVPNMP